MNVYGPFLTCVECESPRLDVVRETYVAQSRVMAGEQRCPACGCLMLYLRRAERQDALPLELGCA